jgi:hypothetical protein
MLKEQADKTLAELSSRFRGEELELLTHGNDHAREAGIPQQYRVRLHLGDHGAAAAVGQDELADLLEVAKVASTGDSLVELGFWPVNRGRFEIRVVFE